MILVYSRLISYICIMSMVRTAGIFFVSEDWKLLVAHPTGHAFDFWTIPKGKLDEGETELEAAMRETWEETNVDLGLASSIIELEPVKYKSGRKELKPFIIFEHDNRRIDSETFTFKCNSKVGEDARWNAGKPEMDGWRWITLKEAKKVLHEAQLPVLDYIKKLKKEKDGEKK